MTAVYRVQARPSRIRWLATRRCALLLMVGQTIETWLLLWSFYPSGVDQQVSVGFDHGTEQRN
jgi:hypothetical protein